MSTLILSNYGKSIQDLNAITEPNKLAYAEKHGYKFENNCIDYSGDQLRFLHSIKARLDVFEIVMTMGCDAMFMNFSREIDPAEGASITLAREHISWWPINNDVVIWRNTREAHFVLQKLIDDEPIWSQYPWLWQNHIWNLMQRETIIDHAVDIREAREMNACLQGGLGQWQLGDWILHLLNFPNAKKVEYAKDYLRLAGNGCYYPKGKTV